MKERLKGAELPWCKEESLQRLMRPTVKWPRQGLEGAPGPVSSQGGSGRAWRQPGPVTSQGDPTLVLQGGALVIPNMEDAVPYFSETLGRPRRAGACEAHAVDA